MAKPIQELEIDIAEVAEQFSIIIRIKNARKTRNKMRLMGWFLLAAQKIAPMEVILISPNHISNPECRAGFACAEIDPYGFVPEDGCPIHDDGDIFNDEDDFDDYVERLRRAEGDH